MEKLHFWLVEKVAKATENIKRNKKQVITSVISLVVSVMILISATLAWFTLTESDVSTGVMKLDAGLGLRVNDGQEETNTITIKGDSTLIPASSVDGYNLYFPQDGTFSSVTDEMRFRSANVGDKNVHFIQVDFTLTADADVTDVFIDTENSYITVGGSAERAGAIRVAFLDERNRDPIVLNSYASSSDYSRKVQAVENVSNFTGKVTNKEDQTSYSFAAFSSLANNPIVSLDASESTKISVIVWLEGTDDLCTSSISGKDLDICLSFTSSWETQQTVSFIDDTTDKWLTEAMEEDGSSLILEYTKADGSSTTFTLYQDSDGSWFCNIPENVTSKLVFKRVDSNGNVLQTWAKDTVGESTTDRGTSTVYYAYDGSIPNNASTNECTGYWLTNDDENDIDKDEFEDFDDIFNDLFG